MEPKQGNFTLAASGDKVELNVRGLNTLAIQVVGAMSATLAFEGTVDGRNWFALNATPTNSNTAVTSTTAAGVWFANVAGLIAVRVRCSAWTSGTPTIAIQAVHSGSAGAAGATNGMSVTLATALQGLVAGAETNSIISYPGFRSDSFNAVGTFTASTTPQSVKALTSAKSHYITDISISVDAAMWVQLVDTDGTAITGAKYLPANSVWSKTYRTPKKVITAKAILLDCSVSSGNVTVDVDGYTI